MFVSLKQSLCDCEIPEGVCSFVCWFIFGVPVKFVCVKCFSTCLTGLKCIACVHFNSACLLLFGSPVGSGSHFSFDLACVGLFLTHTESLSLLGNDDLPVLVPKSASNLLVSCLSTRISPGTTTIESTFTAGVWVRPGTRYQTAKRLFRREKEETRTNLTLRRD